MRTECLENLDIPRDLRIQTLPPNLYGLSSVEVQKGPRFRMCLPHSQQRPLNERLFQPGAPQYHLNLHRSSFHQLILPQQQAHGLADAGPSRFPSSVTVTQSNPLRPQLLDLEYLPRLYATRLVERYPTTGVCPIWLMMERRDVAFLMFKPILPAELRVHGLSLSAHSILTTSSIRSAMSRRCQDLHR